MSDNSVLLQPVIAVERSNDVVAIPPRLRQMAVVLGPLGLGTASQSCAQRSPKCVQQPLNQPLVSIVGWMLDESARNAWISSGVCGSPVTSKYTRRTR
ncbi:MAG TPA: hypothetical protein VNZ26_16880, partial [Vicinamibacterales bacterium]|nr:hypothetical protein [Vicinamibacterales bacterium]